MQGREKRAVCLRVLEAINALAFELTVCVGGAALGLAILRLLGLLR